jgi:Ca2+-transporting ATPase
VGTEGALAECLKAGLLATESQLVQKDGRWDVEGDPTEVALIVAARKAGFSEEALAKSLPRIDIIPFESERQYMATLHASGKDRETLVYVKGGVEVVLGRCVNMMDGAGGTIPLQAEEILEHAEQMASQGLRVLALGRGKLPAAAKALSHADVASSLTFLGLQGMIDPPRQEAIAAVRACQAAGISVKMITGDHVLTASAIAQQIGLDGAGSPTASPQALTGKAMAKLADEELAAAAERVAVFARVSPEQKLRLVEALQSRGHVVAMTGDGVNDAPALKQADIGVAMGITGTDVAKDAADIVLTDDNFATIEAAVEEGRGVFDNLTKFIVWTLPTNLGEALLVLTAVVSGAMLPILPVQILWINMTTAVLLGMTLAFEPKEPGIMQRPPRDPRKPLLTSDVVWRMILVGGFMLAGGFGLFEWELNSGADLTEARTVAVNVFVLIELFYLFNCRSLTRSAFQVGFFSNRWVLGGAGAMLALQVMFTYLPIMNRLFQSAPLSGWAWLRVVALGVTVFAVVGLEKWARRRALAARAAV